MLSRVIGILALSVICSTGAGGARGEDCNLPRVPVDATAVLVGTSTPMQYSSSYLETADGPGTFVVEVAVSDGDGAIYFVGATTNRIVWRFSGAVERVIQVVLMANRMAQG